MPIPLSAKARGLADAQSFAVLATLNDDGSPQNSVLWVLREGDDLLMSTLKRRRKHANLVRDPRVSVVLFDPADPYRYVEVRGTATLTDDPAGELIDALSRKYNGTDFEGRRPGDERVIIRVRAETLAGWG
jgi:PPOX class probable F420-dependent enzyme